MIKAGGMRGHVPGAIYDAWGGIVSKVYFDADGTRTHIQTQNVTPIIEANKRSQNSGMPKDKMLRHHARIPHVVLMQWLREAGIRVRDFQMKPQAYAGWLDAKLQDPDNRFLLV